MMMPLRAMVRPTLREGATLLYPAAAVSGDGIMQVARHSDARLGEVVAVRVGSGDYAFILGPADE